MMHDVSSPGQGGIYAVDPRSTLDNRNPDGRVPEQRITVEEALRAYTSSAAYASFEEGIKGTLEPGRLADFVVMDSDIRQASTAYIRDTHVLMTVGGRVVYEWR